MMKKRFMLFILLVFTILISGCETVKGAFQGMQKDWQTVEKIDAWIRENLW